MSISRGSLCVIGVLMGSIMWSQELPPEMFLFDEGHQLHTGGMPSTGFYEKHTIRTLDLQFAQPNHWQQLMQNYASGTDLLAALTCEGVTYDSIGVRFKGQTSFMMLPPGAQKRSFNITLDHVIVDQHLMGYETLNLNNAFQDASFLREVVYLDLIRDHVPAAKGNFVHLNINGENWGIYPNIQQLNSQFVKEWYFSNNGSLWRADRPDGAGQGSGGPGQWGDGTAALNDLGPDSTTYQEHYTLKRSEQAHPWADLVTTCQRLEQLPLDQLEDSLVHYMDVDRALWFLATEVAFGDDDGYVHKGKMDYYLYWDEETGRMTPLEFDGNSVMKTNTVGWSPFYHANNANYPLMNRLFAVPELRQRYLAHLRTLIAEKMQSDVFDELIAGYVALIDAEVQADPIKLYSYNAFNTEVEVLKNYITSRREHLNGNTEVAQLAPVITSVSHFVNGMEWEAPFDDEVAHVNATITSANGISQVTLYYGMGLTGRFQSLVMHDDGAHNDGAAGDGVYGAAIPSAPGMTRVRYYVEAAADNPARSVSYAPPGAEHDVFTYQVQFQQATNPPVVVNELMALNNNTVVDQQGDLEDWIELYNTTDAVVDLSGGWLSDDALDPLKWQFPVGSVVPAGSYLIIWADDETNDGYDHAAFKLSANGEEVLLTGPDGLLWDHVVFGPQVADLGYARVPNGSGPFVVQAPTFAGSNDGAIGVDELDPATGTWFFPNPVISELTIRSTGAPQEMRILDALGRTVWTGRVDGITTVATGEWPAGAYFLRHAHGVDKLLVLH